MGYASSYKEIFRENTHRVKSSGLKKGKKRSRWGSCHYGLRIGLTMSCVSYWVCIKKVGTDMYTQTRAEQRKCFIAVYKHHADGIRHSTHTQSRKITLYCLYRPEHKKMVVYSSIKNGHTLQRCLSAIQRKMRWWRASIQLSIRLLHSREKTFQIVYIGCDWRFLAWRRTVSIMT